jgi:hypothetical protein
MFQAQIEHDVRAITGEAILRSGLEQRQREHETYLLLKNGGKDCKMHLPNADRSLLKRKPAVQRLYIIEYEAKKKGVRG